MFNLVVLTGRCAQDPELKTTPNGVSVCSFDIAVDSGYGENKQTNFIKIVAWRRTAELIAKHFRKGSMIGIEGQIQTHKYTDKNGNKRTAFEVVANNFQFLESKKDVNVSADETTVENPESQFTELGSIDADDLPF